MANIVAIQLEVDAGKSVKEVQNLEEAIKDIQKTTTVDNVEQKFDSLNMSIKNGAGSVEDMRKAIKSYQTIALTAGRTSPIGKDAILRASQLKDQLTYLDNEVNRLSKDGQAMQGALQGAKPADAFFVNIGLGVTMTSQDILEGRMNIEIGLAAVRPAEFIILKFSHKLQES